MKRYIFLIGTVIISLLACEQGELSDASYKSLPKVLFVTTGNDNGIGELPAGVSIAQRYFNSRGIMFFIEPRDVLLEPERLAKYDILILSTSAGYHDADRLYSLSFMSDEELLTIRDWVLSGGVLVAGDNTGRNYLNGYDRISEFGELNPSNWPLAEVFDLRLTERNMAGFRIVGSLGGEPEHILLDSRRSDFWTLVGDSAMTGITETWAWWSNDSLRFPAITSHTFGKGEAILLASSYFLHPANAGGFAGVAGIEELYGRILGHVPGYSDNISLNMWPGSSNMAFAFTAKATGEAGELVRAADFLNRNRIPATILHSPSSSAEGLSGRLDAQAETASGGFSLRNYRDLSYSETLNEIIANERDAGMTFHGFRFPLGLQSYWGLVCLDDRKYTYDSSIPVDQLSEPSGAIFPYHPPVSSRGYFRTLDLIELPVMQFGDDHYFGDFNMSENPLLLEKRSLLFAAYLQRFRSEIAAAYGGMMICEMTTSLSLRNDTTLYPLASLVDTLVNQGSTWFCTLSELSSRWAQLEQLTCLVDESDKEMTIRLSLPDGVVIDDLSFRLSRNARSVRAKKGNATTKTAGGITYLVCEGMDGQVIRIRW